MRRYRRRFRDRARLGGAVRGRGRDCRRSGSCGTAYRVDVGDEEETKALAARVLDEHGRIDVLFDNAGIAGVGDTEETTLEMWERVMRVNARGVFLMSRAVVPAMKSQRSGSIINMASAVVDIGIPRRVSYAASKGAVMAMTKSMQVDLAPFGVRVNALLPGTIMTPFVEVSLRVVRRSRGGPALDPLQAADRRSRQP